MVFLATPILKLSAGPQSPVISLHTKDSHLSKELVLGIGHKDQILLKKNCWDFPGGPVLVNPPCCAGDMGLIHGWGTKIPRAPDQLSLSTTISEPVHPGTGMPQLESPQGKISRDSTKRPDAANKYIVK